MQNLIILIWNTKYSGHFWVSIIFLLLSVHIHVNIINKENTQKIDCALLCNGANKFSYFGSAMPYWSTAQGIGRQGDGGVGIVCNQRFCSHEYCLCYQCCTILPTNALFIHFWYIIAYKSHLENIMDSCCTWYAISVVLSWLAVQFGSSTFPCWELCS